MQQYTICGLNKIKLALQYAKSNLFVQYVLDTQ